MEREAIGQRQASSICVPAGQIGRGHRELRALNSTLPYGRCDPIIIIILINIIRAWKSISEEDSKEAGEYTRGKYFDWPTMTDE
jgi:hypothetical protein